MKDNDVLKIILSFKYLDGKNIFESFISILRGFKQTYSL